MVDLDLLAHLAKELTRIRVKVDRLALYAFLTLAIIAGSLVHSALVEWLGSGWGLAASIATAVIAFFALRKTYPL